MASRAAAKARGASFETDIRDLLRAQPFAYDVERLRLNGKEDEGDVVVKDSGGVIAILEAKAAVKYDLGGWMTEALLERDHYAAHRGLDREQILPFVVVKRRMKPIAESFCITTLGEFFR